MPTKTLKEARATLRALGVRTLLATPIANPKLAKTLKLRIMTAPLHLAPAKLSGYEVCPMSTAGCRAACLHTAGNPAYMRGKARARQARTVAFFKARDAFMTALVGDVEKLARKAARQRMRCGVRLNATSDIVWEAIPCVRNGKAYPNIMVAFPRVQFYDYTKRHNRRALPANYHLTYSLAENNAERAAQAFAAGANVAAVFAVPRGKPLPATVNLWGWQTPVIDGDVHDYRPADPRGVIVGLRAKGQAIGDASGFVIAA